MDYDTYIEEVTDKEENLEEDGWFSTIFKKRKMSSVENEIKRYLLEDVADRKENLLEYWRLKSAIFPSLASMAKVYLAIPSTSTPPERAFSNGHFIVHHTRCSLSAEKIRALLCLNNWFRQNFIQFCLFFI